MYSFRHASFLHPFIHYSSLAQCQRVLSSRNDGTGILKCVFKDIISFKSKSVISKKSQLVNWLSIDQYFFPCNVLQLYQENLMYQVCER